MHKAIMVDEVIENLVTDIDGVYVDATLGFGGHTSAILSRLSKEGRVIGIDQDMDALSAVNLDITKVKANFSSIDVVLHLCGVDRVSAILADIGLSSYQIDNRERGFSYVGDGPLDMRMDQSSVKSARDILNSYSEEDLADIIYKYGEERLSRRVARAIVQYRRGKALERTEELRDIVAKINRHSLKRVFQAIRIEVNDELGNLTKFLHKAYNALEIGGRLAVISFHSLEDRIVKNFIRDNMVRLHKKAIVASDEERLNNPRSTSAKLRIAEKVAK